ncbi:MAG: exodeoxyribonuclease VII large subunit [Chloroflexi bacterium]|nr:exodeoxyribonuclease VII large subunit [Chloroflexota bacterium]
MTNSATENSRSIAQVNRMLRSILEAETLEQFFWVGGKIDRFHKSERGHVYFDLVDDWTRIRCMMREERTGHIAFDLHNHLDVEVFGDVRFYEERGEAQINVVDLRLSDTVSASAPAMERLRAEGLYPPAKRQPPADIRRIGIVTSQSSRAIGDFESAYQSAGERGVLAPVRWKYSLLEGDRAVQSLADAIRSLDEEADVDLIAVIRGGGRQENFAPLDSYEIARAVLECKTYIVTGIGHHRDSTLADEMADYAASTPTAAAHYIADLCLKSQPKPASSPPSSKRSRIWILLMLAVAGAAIVVVVGALLTQVQG